MQSLYSKILGAKLSRSHKILVASLLVLAVSLAMIAGNRLSGQAWEVLAGAVCGVAAAIPTSVLTVAIARRKNRPPRGWDSTQSQETPVACPCEIVVIVPPQLPDPAVRRLPLIGPETTY